MSILIFLLLLIVSVLAQNKTEFTYNGFQGSINKLHLDGIANILPNGLLQMTDCSIDKTSYACYLHPISFKPNQLSFSTTFVFAMIPRIHNIMASSLLSVHPQISNMLSQQRT